MLNKLDLLSSLQNYDTSESKLRREFEVYGAVRKVLETEPVNCSGLAGKLNIDLTFHNYSTDCIGS